MRTRTELIAAVRTGEAAAVAQALGSGASLDERDPRGHTALMVACEHDHAAVASALLEAGASPNRRTTDREETVLHQLARRPEADALLADVAREDVDPLGEHLAVVAAVLAADRLEAVARGDLAQEPVGRGAAGRGRTDRQR